MLLVHLNYSKWRVKMCKINKQFFYFLLWNWLQNKWHSTYFRNIRFKIHFIKWKNVLYFSPQVPKMERKSQQSQASWNLSTIYNPAFYLPAENNCPSGLMNSKKFHAIPISGIPTLYGTWRKIYLNGVSSNIFLISIDWIDNDIISSVPNVNFEVYAPSFLERFLESHAVMFQGNAGLKPKEGEITSRPWQWPINYRVSYLYT